MKRDIESDVLVIGAGPVGLFGALAAVRRGLKVEIIDSLPSGSRHTYALALHPGTLELFREYGLLEAVSSGSREVRRLDFYRGQELATEIDLPSAGSKTAGLLVVGQHHLETVLEHALKDSGVQVRRSHRAADIVQEPRQVEVRVDELEQREVAYAVSHGEGYVRRSHLFKAPFVIGADGFKSITRRKLGIGFPVVGPAEDYAVFEFETECEMRDAFLLIETDGVVNVRWPTEPNVCRWSFQLLMDGTPPEYLRDKDPSPVQRLDHTDTGKLDAERLHALLAERAPWCTARLTQSFWNVWVRFERRLAERFGSERVWLAGDAAHLTSPVGVQSMNVGLREVTDLAARMEAVLTTRETLDTLEVYNRERLSEWRFLHGLDGGLKASRNAPSSLADLADRLLPWLPASGNELADLANRLGFEVEGLPPVSLPTGRDVKRKVL